MSDQAIAKHGVYQMFGFEIQDCENLGLDPQKIYQVLRDKNFTIDVYKQLINNEVPLKVKGISEQIGVITDIEMRDCYIDCGFHVFSKDVFNTEIKDKLQIYPALSYQSETLALSGFYEGVYYDLSQSNPKVDSIYMVERAKQPL